MKKLSKKEKTRINIMHAAKGLFESHGIENVTFNQIAENADVCRTTVFNHFSDIGELMLALTTQEITDVREYCIDQGVSGRELAYKLFSKLIEDAALYPKLTAKLMTNAILSQEEDNPIRVIEELVIDAFKGEYTEEEAEDLAVLISGAYYGLINHYHINNKKFVAEEMKLEFENLLCHIMKA